MGWERSTRFELKGGGESAPLSVFVPCQIRHDSHDGRGHLRFRTRQLESVFYHSQEHPRGEILGRVASAVELALSVRNHLVPVVPAQEIGPRAR